MTLSKMSDYCRFAFSVGALEKGKQTQGILKGSRNNIPSADICKIHLSLPHSILQYLNISVVWASTSGLKQVFV